MAGGIKLAPLLTEIKVDIENFKSDMEKAAAIGTSEAKRISQEMETTAKVGEKFSKAGDLLTKGLTLPIVGVGAATTKMAVDFESSFAKVSTLLDSNVVDFAQYKNELLNASSETKVAVDEFSEAVYSSISAGVDQKEAIQFTLRQQISVADSQKQPEHAEQYSCKHTPSHQINDRKCNEYHA